MSIDLGSIYSSLDLKLDKFDAEVKKALKGYYELQTGTEKASSIMDTSVNTAVSNIEKSYQLWEKANERSGKSLFDNSKKVESFKSQIKLLDDEIKKSDEILKSIEKSLGKDAEGTEKYKARVLDLKLAHSQLVDELKKAEKETTTFAGKLEILEKQFDKASEKYQAFSKVGDSLSSAGNKLTMGLTMPIVGTGVAIEKFFTEFEDGMAQISTVADTSRVSIEDLGDGVKQLSDDAGLATKDIQEGLYDTISSGVKTEEAMNFLTVAVKAAKGGFTDTKTSVDGLTTTLNAYGIEAEKATEIANQMMVAQNLGKTTFGEMASSIGNVVPTAAALGVETQELFSSLAVLTANGIKTSEAVTGLKAAFSNVVKPSKEASDAAETLGLKFDAAEVKSKGWIGFLKEVKEKLSEVAPEYAKALEQYDQTVVKMGQMEDAGQKNTEMYKALKKSLKGQKDEIDLLEKASSSQISAFATMFGSVEALNSVLTLTSDQGMALYQESIGQMGDGTDRLTDAFNTMNETAGAKFSKSLQSLKNSAIDLGAAAAPILEDLGEGLKSVANFLNSLSDEQKKSLVRWAEIIAIGGPVISMLGGITKGIGTVKTTLEFATKFAGGFKAGMAGVELAAGAVEAASVAAAGTAGAGGLAGLGSALGGVAVAAAPWLLAGAAVVGTGYAINKVMSEEVVPSVDLFADRIETTSQKVENSAGQIINTMQYTSVKISDETKNAVGAYIKMDDDVKKTLTNLYINGAKITADTTNSIIQKYNDMGNQIKTGMDKRYNEELNIMQQFFQKSGVLNDSEEQKALNDLQKNNAVKKAELDNYTKQIQAIMQKASSENRTLTLSEQQQINNIQEQMKNNAINTLSENEIEAKVIIGRIKDYGAKITAEQASEVIKNAEKQRVESVDKANKQYEETVASITYMRDVTHSLTADQAQKLIDDAERQRKESVDKAGELKKGVVDKLTEMSPEVTEQVDLQTGSIVTGWEAVKTWWDKLWFPKKTMEVEQKVKVNTEYNNLYGDLYEPPTYNGAGGIPGNATGTDYWRGGLTTVHEMGYELYDLPRGTRIFNHDASQELVLKTAESVAAKVASNVLASANGNGGTSSIINFNGNYSFGDKKDIDYFMNRAAKLVQRRRG